MGEPALAIVEEAAGEEAVRQTVRLTVIEGGAAAAEAGSAVVAGEAAAGEAAALGIGGAAVATAGIALAVIGLAALGYYLYKRSSVSEPGSLPKQKVPPRLEMVVACQSANPVTQSESIPSASSTVTGDTSQPKSDKCPPHAWIVEKNGDNPDDAIKKLRDEAKKRTDESARGYDFEAGAIEKNKVRGIEATNREYKCTKCGAIQEVDIVFKDGRLGEYKSKNARQMAKDKVKKQALKYVDIQRQMNELRQSSQKPLAKLDSSDDLKNTIDQNGRTSEQIMRKRGYEIELLPPA